MHVSINVCTGFAMRKARSRKQGEATAATEEFILGILVHFKENPVTSSEADLNEVPIDRPYSQN